jgi:nitroreductase
MDVHEALRTRRSVRAFLSDPVAEATVRSILALAARAPSGSNTQPWRVHVLTGAARHALSQAVHAYRNANPGVDHRQYDYYPVRWREPYLARRRKVGWDLYALLGIARGETAKAFRQHGRNFDFFDAPVGLIFTIDGELERGSWIDYGMFLQSVMLAARGYGLHTCPQAAWIYYHDIVRRVLGLPDSELVVCGMCLGYQDTAAPASALETERAAVDDFATFRS